MAEIYCPFESLNTGTASEPVYDRAITAEMERTFNKLRYTNGVFSSVGSGLTVSANNNMTVTVGSGGAHIEGAMYINTAPLNLTVEAASASLNRIDRVVLQFNTSVSVRSVRALIRTGTAATNPVAPELRQESNLFEIALADIYVKKGATGIAQSAITDQRLNSALCGFVVAAIPSSVDTTGLFDQYQTALNEWLDMVAAALDDTLAGNLQNQITALGTRLTAEESKVQPIAKGGTGATTAEVARKNLGLSKYADLNPETLIPSGADLNDYREVGSYKSVNAANSKTLSNTPYTDGGFNLQVISTSLDDIKQILIANSAKTALVYIRSITASGAFNDWAQMGTTVIEKVWENASPTSSFATQALTLDLSALTPSKDLVAIEAAINNAADSGVDTFIGAFVNGKRGIRMGFVYGANSKNMSYYRSAAFTSDKKLTFNNAYASSPTQDALDNTKCIPLSIYTVKGVL